MLKFLGFLVVIGLAFGAGVYVGRQGPENVLHKAKQFGAEVVAKTGSVERNVSVRMGLVNAKERLVQAKSDLLDKNYGKATAGLDEAAQALATAKASAGEELREKLQALAGKLSSIKGEIQAVKPGVQAKLDELVKDLDRMIGK
jgi:uncharacterized protein YicC (UPF0701 family)